MRDTIIGIYVHTIVRAAYAAAHGGFHSICIASARMTVGAVAAAWLVSVWSVECQCGPRASLRFPPTNEYLSGNGFTHSSVLSEMPPEIMRMHAARARYAAACSHYIWARVLAASAVPRVTSRDTFPAI